MKRLGFDQACADKRSRRNLNQRSRPGEIAVIEDRYRIRQTDGADQSDEGGCVPPPDAGFGNVLLTGRYSRCNAPNMQVGVAQHNEGESDLGLCRAMTSAFMYRPISPSRA
jgi:hypothetical protein